MLVGTPNQYFWRYFREKKWKNNFELIADFVLFCFQIFCSFPGTFCCQGFRKYSNLFQNVLKQDICKKLLHFKILCFLQANTSESLKTIRKWILGVTSGYDTFPDFFNRMLSILFEFERGTNQVRNKTHALTCQSTRRTRRSTWRTNVTRYQD